MAEEKKAKTENRVKVFVPKGYANEEPNLFVGINGKGYLLPRGKYSEVPPEVAHEIERSLAAQDAADENAAAMQEN